MDAIVLGTLAVTALVTLIAAAFLFARWRRNRYRFSVRALLLVFALSGCGLFVILRIVVPTFEHRWAIQQIRSAGGEVVFRDSEPDGRKVELRNVTARNDQQAITIANQIQQLPEVKALFLYEGVTDVGLEAICRNGKSLSLERIYLSGWNITSSGLAHLANLQQLDSLICVSPAVDDTGLAHLKAIRGLQTLRLEEYSWQRKKRFTDQGFAEIGQLEDLTNLDLSRLNISDSAARHLHSLKRLKSLQLRECQISEDALARLHEASSDCQIEIYGTASTGPVKTYWPKQTTF